MPSSSVSGSRVVKFTMSEDCKFGVTNTTRRELKDGLCQAASSSPKRQCPQLLESQFQELPQDEQLDALQLSRPKVRRPAPKFLKNLFWRLDSQLHGVHEQAQSAPGFSRQKINRQRWVGPISFGVPLPWRCGFGNRCWLLLTSTSKLSSSSS